MLRRKRNNLIMYLNVLGSLSYDAKHALLNNMLRELVNYKYVKMYVKNYLYTFDLY